MSKFLLLSISATQAMPWDMLGDVQCSSAILKKIKSTTSETASPKTEIPKTEPICRTLDRKDEAHEEEWDRFRAHVKSLLPSKPDKAAEFRDDVKQWNEQKHANFIRIFEKGTAAVKPVEDDVSYPGVLFNSWGLQVTTSNGPISFSRMNFQEHGKACAIHFKQRIERLGLVKSYFKDQPKICWEEKGGYHLIKHYVIDDRTGKKKQQGKRFRGSKDEIPPAAYEFAKSLQRPEEGPLKGLWTIK